jgi:hypothetical protein
MRISSRVRHGVNALGRAVAAGHRTPCKHGYRASWWLRCLIAVAVLVGLLRLQSATMTIGGDRYCFGHDVDGRLVCEDTTTSPCSAAEGWKCIETKELGCKCVRVSSAPQRRRQP